MKKGVRMRSLGDVFKAFSIKLWWNFRQGRSLWVNFMGQKYMPRMHACYAELVPGCSPTWRRMVEVQNLAEQHITWVLGKGIWTFSMTIGLGMDRFVHRWKFLASILFVISRKMVRGMCRC